MIRNFPHAHPFFSLSIIWLCTFLLSVSCSSYTISSMLKALILESNNNIPGAGLLHSLACNWHSFSCSRGCLSRTQPGALSLCCLWTSRLLYIRALLGPTHTPRGCLWSRTQPRLCCLWTRACFLPGPYSALHIHLLAAAYGPAHDHVCVAYGPAPALCPGPYWARNTLSGHSVPSSLLLCQLLAPSSLQAQPKSLCVVRADVNCDSYFSFKN